MTLINDIKHDLACDPALARRPILTQCFLLGFIAVALILVGCLEYAW